MGMKYKLINKTTQKEFICDKITFEGYDYYSHNPSSINISNMSVMDFAMATNNPNIDLPKVIEEFNLDKELGEWKYKLGLKGAKEKADEKFENGYSVVVPDKISHRFGYVYGVKEAEERLVPIIMELKSKEAHLFTEEDLISFGKFVNDYDYRILGTKTNKELLQLWKDQQVKTIYYE